MTDQLTINPERPKKRHTKFRTSLKIFLIVFLGIIGCVVGLILWAVISWLIPIKKYDDSYFNQQTVTMAQQYQHQVAALGLQHSVLTKSCYPGVPSGIGGDYSPFEHKVGSDGGILWCEISATVHVSAPVKPTTSYLNGLDDKLVPVMRHQGYKDPYSYRDDYHDSDGYTTLVSASYPRSSNDFCLTTLDYYSGKSEGSKYSSPTLEYYIYCHEPAKDVPPGFSYSGQTQLL